jgi:hypothetical protein
MNDDCRMDPASEMQKDKLFFFGCTWDEGITYGQACDALAECAARFPATEVACRDRPATEAQWATLLSLGIEVVNTKCSTYGQAEQMISDLQTRRFWDGFNPIKARIEKAHMATDDDLAAIELLMKKYDVQLTIVGELDLLHSVFLIEVKNQLPDPISADLMLNNDERAYCSVSTTWHQISRPAESAETKPVANGVLYVTSERLLFSGVAKNTSIGLKKIVNCHCYSDFLKVDKGTGKSDLFAMTAARARYVMALVRALK